MSAGHRFHPSILRAYDVRGIVGESLEEADAEALGRAFGTVIRAQGGARAALGYDGRLSSPRLAAAAARGLAACGLTVIEIGCGPTPMLYFAVHHLEADGGLMVTGSHNPPDYNGFKMVLGKAPVFGEAIQRLGAIAAAGDFAAGEGRREEAAVLEAYVERIARDYDGTRALAAAWDGGNGAVGVAMGPLLARMPGRHRALNAEVDGTFPAHHPDPTVPANLEQLQAAVAAGGLDLGFAFDGDGDRIGAIDERGRILWGDQLMVLIARDVLRERPGATIIADVKASRVLFDEVARLGGRPLMWKTGHSLIKAKMAEEGAPFAGEMSAHLFFADRYYGYDDALYAAVRILGAVSRSGESLGAFRDSLPAVVNTPEIRFPCPEERKFGVIEEVRARLAAAGAEVTAIDGVRVATADGWWLLRASNTQDVLVARCEARDTAGLDRLKGLLAEQLAKSGLEAPADL